MKRKRVEEAALKAYPEKIIEHVEEPGFVVKRDLNRFDRNVYIQGYEQAEKDTIERAVMWLEEHADEYNGSESAFDHMEEEMIIDFRKAMEEE